MLRVYNRVMIEKTDKYYSIENKIVDDVLTNEDIAEIYKAVQNNNGTGFIAPHCQMNTFISLPDSIVNKLTDSAIKASGIENLELTEYCYSRYQNRTDENGKEFRPSLFPHYDESFPEPRFTFDYQLKGTIPWDIVVEDKILTLKDNQAATFSGTHQIHWRTPTIFSPDDFVEMIFCHFSIIGEGPKGSDVNQIMNKKAEFYKESFYANGGFTNG